MKKNDQSGKRKLKKILIIILSSLCGAALLYAAFCLFAGPLFYPDFYKKSEKLCKIPGLSEGFIPQGVTSFEGSSDVIICGYMQNGSNSRIYIVKDGKETVKILLSREDGSVYKGHAGGVTAAGDYLYVSNASKIFVLDKNAVLSSKDEDTVSFSGSFPVSCRSSFCSSDGQYLYVGEYHAEGYETDASHVIKTSDGSENAAFVYAYALSAGGEYGLADPSSPDFVISVCDEVQGFAFLSGARIVLSCSSGLSDSVLRRYDASGDPDGTVDGIPLLILDGKRHVEDIKMPHMSEDIEFRGTRLMVGFEAGARKYGSGLLPFSVGSVTEITMPDPGSSVKPDLRNPG
ncbi:MAG: hypothetical protein J6V01_05600 [Clostridia bacterium]|nr:hypothetical protein [Clostridia bacterium]